MGKIFSGDIASNRAKEIVNYFEDLMKEMKWLAKMANSFPESKIQTALDIVSQEYGQHHSEAIGMIINAGDIKFAGVVPRTEVGAYIESVEVRARLLAWVVQMATSDPGELDAAIKKFRDKCGDKAANTILGRILEAEEAVHRGHWGKIRPEDIGLPERYLVFYTLEGYPIDWGEILGESDDNKYYRTYGGSGRKLELQYEKGYCEVFFSEQQARKVFEAKEPRRRAAA